MVYLLIGGVLAVLYGAAWAHNIRQSRQRPAGLTVTGRLYRGGQAAQRHNRRAAGRQESWLAARDGLGTAGAAAVLVGLAVLAWAPPGAAYGALALILAAGPLSASAAYAQWRARRLARDAAVRAMRAAPVRYSIDNAPTVTVPEGWQP